MGLAKKVLQVGSGLVGGAIGGPAGAALASGLTGVGTSLASGNGLGSSLVNGGLNAATSAISAPKATPTPSVDSGGFGLGNFADKLSIAPKPEAPSLLTQLGFGTPKDAAITGLNTVGDVFNIMNKSAPTPTMQVPNLLDTLRSRRR